MTVFRWDIDKSYLHTNFDTVSDLVKVATENASEKQTINGAAPLIRALNQITNSSLVFISGSPKQMRKVLLEKFDLDGIKVDQIILKDSLSSIKRGRIRDITNQFAYKLIALLKDRLNYAHSENEYLFGDSAEVDAYVYSTYALILSNQISTQELRYLMRQAGAYSKSIEILERLRERLEYGGQVKRIFIRLVEGQSCPQFRLLYPLVVPVFHWSQACMVLLEEKMISFDAVYSVLAEEGWTNDQSANVVQDLQRRSFISPKTASKIYEKLSVNRSILSISPSISKITANNIYKAMG